MADLILKEDGFGVLLEDGGYLINEATTIASTGVAALSLSTSVLGSLTVNEAVTMNGIAALSSALSTPGTGNTEYKLTGVAALSQSTAYTGVLLVGRSILLTGVPSTGISTSTVGTIVAGQIVALIGVTAISSATTTVGDAINVAVPPALLGVSALCLTPVIAGVLSYGINTRGPPSLSEATSATSAIEIGSNIGGVGSTVTATTRFGYFFYGAELVRPIRNRTVNTVLKGTGVWQVTQNLSIIELP